MKRLLSAFAPNRALSPASAALLALGQAATLVLLWLRAPPAVLPGPREVLAALRDLWWNQGLGRELWTSLSLSAQAVALSSAIALLLAWLTVVPFFRPLAAAASKGRFLGLVGVTFTFTLAVGGGHPLKLSLLTFGMSVFLLTAMSAEVAAVPRERFDHARTLRLGEWGAAFEVVVLGTSDRALEVIRQNAAIGWTLLTMVEGLSRSEGGVGALLLNQHKHFHLAAVFAVQLAILAVGLAQDAGLGLLRRVACPWAVLDLERSKP
ncbi:MAG: nitrate ABC transporter permease [Deltaproteobacteria bacterium]|nr:nitrate ABC transporter permease [Deltaproteobacteria bacterium]